jgi:subtilisin-like proprotein convertase family protein
MEDSKMDEIKRNVPKTFRDRVSAIRYLMVLTALVAVAAVGYTFLPEAEVSAQTGDTKAGAAELETPEAATQAMIDFALNLKTASEYTVYAERGITDRGTSEIRGAKGDAMRSAAGRKSTKELSNSIDALRQLPCTELKSGALAGRTFTPGVYCLNSAELDGEMAIDGQGSAEGTFIFRVAGSLVAKGGSSIRVENGAQGGNVYFVAENAEIGDNAAFRAHVLASGNIKIGSGATVTDKVMALGKVELNDSALLGGTTGSLEICKRQQLPVAAANDLSNQIFHFVVTGVAAGSPGSAANPLRVPVGSCSSPIDVTAGPQTVTELNTGTLITPPTGTFTGNFELISVVNVTPASPSTLGLVNLATRVANINIVAGGVNTQLTLEFTNRRTITGFVEICKRAATGPSIPLPGPGNTLYNPPGTNPLSGGDPDVTGFFQYTIEDVYAVNQQNPNVKTLQIFTIPVGQCTGPIAVTKGDPAPFPFPVGEVASLAFVSELPRAGAYLESVEVTPPDRANGPFVLGTIVGVSPTGADVFIPAPGGGFQDTFIIESASAANETLLVFANRSNPSRVKVCKVAGPGIPINTLFTFTVVGWGATSAAHPQVATYGLVSRTFDVRAGDPAQGGTCEFVPGLGANPPGYNQFQTFVNGTPVYIYENGISINNTIPQNPGQLRVSQIRVFGSSFTSTAIAGFSPNPQLVPAPATTEVFQTAGPIALPDVTTVTVPVNVPDAGLVSDVNAGIRLNHTFDADQDISLSDPAGRTIDLSSDNGGSGDNYGTGSNDCAGSLTTFDDEAGTSITAGVAPFSGSFRPEGSLATFDGRGMNGTWNFTFTDDLGGDVGTLGCARLSIENSAFVARAAVFARASIVEVEFTNFRFNPTVLKVCKIGLGAALGQNFDFTVALVSPQIGGANPGPMFPPYSQNVTVTAGPGNTGQEGNCTFVNPTGLLGGAFNQGQTYTVTEAGTSVINAVYSLSSSGWTWPGAPSRTATASGPNGLVAGINSVTFVNSPAAPDPVNRPVKFDFDGDRKADVAVFTPSNGNWSWLASSQGNQLRGRGFGINGDKLVAADYDGDGKTDYAVYRPSEGKWYVQGTTNIFEGYNWGEAGDIPQTGDYDGDGKSDLIIFRPANGTWYIRTMSGNFSAFQFGIPTDKPVAADYDGDGRTDVAVFRNGTWYTLGSNSGFTTKNFGQTGDVPVPADYDGDGTADVAVFRGGMWYTLNAAGFTQKQHGVSTDIPVPADYDGDGLADIAVFRGTEGKWYIKRSSQGEASSFDVMSLGSSTDAAVQAAQ